MAADRPSTRRFSLAQLILLVPWVAVVIDSLAPVTDNSYLWHITAGDLQRSSGSALTADPFSFTVAGDPWLTQSWLAELFYSVNHEWFGIGFTGAMMLIAGLITIGGITVYVYVRSESFPATAIVVVLTTALFIAFHVPRPVLFSYSLFVLLVLAWEIPRLRWTVPFVMWTWASVHASFAIGLLFLGLMVVWRKEWRAWPYLLAGSVVTLLTAHGLGVLSVLTDFVSARPYLSLITEWRTPDFLSPSLLPFLIGVVVLIYGSMKGRLSPNSLWLIVPFLAVGVSATRSVATAWIGLLPALALALKGTTWRFGRGFPAPIAGAFAVLILAFPFLFAGKVTIDEERFPVAARAAAQDVRTFHDDIAGGYLIYAGQFSTGVFIDDRAELYRERIREFVEVRTGREDWRTVFARDGIEQALLKADEPLVRNLDEAGWVRVYEDDFFVVLRP